MSIHETITASDCGANCPINLTTSVPSDTEDNLVKTLVQQVLKGNWNNLSYSLSKWQVSQLKNIEEAGVSCLLNMWFKNQQNFTEGTFCNAIWDNVYCWPPTPTGQIVTRECSEVLHEMEQPYAKQIKGTAFRVCMDNGSWLLGNWTNYTQCADSYDQYVWNAELLQKQERQLVVAVQHILFIGSIISLFCLATSLSIFFYFKCLWCDRVTVHVHLMIALLLRSVLLIIITEPFVFGRTNHYRNEDFICKMVLSVDLYATAASINWMFIQGVYLHGKLTTNVFDKGPPFKIYYTIGWILPLILIGVYAIVMETYHPVKCWKDYSDRPELWIVLAPMIVALLANLLFLMDIMRILLTKVRRRSLYTDGTQFRRAIKATLILFPLLGVNNFILLYNPGGDFDKYYVICNTLFGSTQGIFVAIFYCFVSRDVRDAVRREYRRFLARRSANNAARRSSGNAIVAYSVEAQRPPRTQFRSTRIVGLAPTAVVPRNSRSDERSGSRISGNNHVELMPMGIIRVAGPAGSKFSNPSPSSPFLSCCNCLNGSCGHNSVQAKTNLTAALQQLNQQAGPFLTSDLRYDF